MCILIDTHMSFADTVVSMKPAPFVIILLVTVCNRYRYKYDYGGASQGGPEGHDLSDTISISSLCPSHHAMGLIEYHSE